MSKQKRYSKSLARVHRTFTEEFKRDALSLVTHQEEDTLAAVARSIGLHPNLIRKRQKFMSESNEQAVVFTNFVLSRFGSGQFLSYTWRYEHSKTIKIHKEINTEKSGSKAD